MKFYTDSFRLTYLVGVIETTIDFCNKSKDEGLIEIAETLEKALKEISEN